MKQKCPTCKKMIKRPVENEKISTFYPFCSQRCRLVDLGSWFDGNYKICTKLQSKPEEDDNEL